jgi:hypothetical protein
MPQHQSRSLSDFAVVAVAPLQLFEWLRRLPFLRESDLQSEWAQELAVSSDEVTSHSTRP